MPDEHLPSDPAAEADSKRAAKLFYSSQTFLLRTPDPSVTMLRIITISALLLLFFVGIPLLAITGKVPDGRVNLLGQFLCFGIVALGIDLIWGYTGLLSLCQALFFALGGYAMGMHLSLPEGGGNCPPDTGIPQFMSFAYYGHGNTLPWFWIPFRHFWFAVFAGMAVPGLIGALFGFFILRKRVRGVYFSIVTQALAQASWLLISRNEMLLGGTNGLNSFYPAFTSDRRWKIGLYLLTLSVLVAAYIVCRIIVKSRLGRVLIAVRDKETRLYFAGYKPYAFKVFAFAVGAMLAGVGGMLYAPQLGIVNPQSMDVQASIFMVVMVALGGRGRLWGAVFGALLFFIARSSLTSDLSSGWDLVVGSIAVLTVLVLPEGLSGLWISMERQMARQDLWGRYCAAITGLPLLVISLFLIFEILGLTPMSLRANPAHPGSIPPKYIVLLLVLGLAAVAHWLNQRTNRNTALRAAEAAAEVSTTPSALAAVAKGGA